VWNTATNVKGGNASWLQLDLGDTYDIDALKFWNYHSKASTDDRRGLKTFTLMAWGANESWSVVSRGVHLARAGRSASDPYYGFAYKAVHDALPPPFDQGSSDVVSWLPVTARYLRLTDFENYGVSKWGNGYGLSEIKIFRLAEATTPEPSVAEEATTTREKQGLLTDRDEEDGSSSSSEEPRPVARTTDSAHRPHRHLHNGTFAGPPAGAEEAHGVFLDEAGFLPIVLLGVLCLGWIAVALWKKRCPELLPCKPWGHKSGCEPLCVEEEQAALSSQEARYKKAAQKEDAVPSESDSENDGPGSAAGVRCSGGLRRSMFERLRRGASMRSPRGVSPRGGGRGATSPKGATAPVSPYPRSSKRNG
jgi:hypothetical protein